MTAQTTTFAVDLTAVFQIVLDERPSPDMTPIQFLAVWCAFRANRKGWTGEESRRKHETRYERSDF